MKPFKTPVLLAALISGGILAAPAHAESSTSALIDKLIERGVLTEQDVRDLREAEARESEAVADQIKAEDRYQGLEYEPTLPLQTVDDRIQARKFRVESQDGKNRFGLRGRLMVDAEAANWDDNLSEAANEADPIPEYGTFLRRARLGAIGVYDNLWEWQLEVDFRDSEVRFANAYVARLFDSGRLAVGNFKEPFSLESSTSSRRLTFMERATPVDAYRPSRQIGLMYETLVPDWYFAAGVFGGDGTDRDRDVEEGYSLATRASFAPYMSEDTFTHLGASFNHRVNATDEGTLEDVRLRSREGARAIDVRLIGRNDLEGVDSYSRYALEAAWGKGPFSLQGEYLRVDLDLDREQVLDAHGSDATDKSSLTLDGYYIQASYFLTGEQRNYRAFSGDFGAVRPNSVFGNGGTGAWEIAARYAHADSLEHTQVGRGNKMDHYTLGLNWYPNQDMVFKLNYMYFDYEGRGGVSNGNHVLAARAQFEF
ncbi:OprO/OprP family phosphate-selective porin [Thioalkalivibrio sp. ALE30]|uniref:OprO/OprP family phosphate-selective porin n=1 Tax=Thioalkalivibrio sp. ALE30 TaxID=1158181 RepID=UPI00035C5652|nr:porin [Thioalkalivibrio sp. ALE30]